MTPAEAAAAAWGGNLVRLVAARENTIWEMTLPDGARAALRLHRPGYRDAATIRSELWWCAALAREGAPVPAALPGLNGDLVQQAGAGLASTIAWLPGAPLGRAGVPLAGTPAEQMAQHRALGRLLARIHTITDRLTLPADFTLPRWDAEGFTGEAPLWSRFWDHPLATEAEAARLRDARAWLAGTLAPLKDIGPIHADVLRENILVNGDSLSLIDFDDSGIGFRLYDLGTALSQSLYEPAFEELRAALIEGYSDTRPCDPALVDAFTLARCLASVGWMIDRLAPDDPIHRRHLDRAFACIGRVIG